jgi:hypothetical protein
MKINITIHNTTPTMTVSGLVRRSDRTGPMPSYVGCPQSMRFGGSGIACVKSGAACSVSGSSRWICRLDRLPGAGFPLTAP